MNDITFPELPDPVQAIPQDDLELLGLIAESDWSEEQASIRPACTGRHDWAPVDILTCGSERCAWRCCLVCGRVEGVSLSDLRQAIENGRDPAA